MADLSPEQDAVDPGPDRSRLSFPDQVVEAAAALFERPLRTALSGILVAVSAALIVVVTALSTTASQQISSRFDALRATTVAVNVAGPDVAGPGSAGPGGAVTDTQPADTQSADVPELLIERFPTEPSKRLSELRNVVAAGALLHRSTKAEVAIAPAELASEIVATGLGANQDLYLSDSGYAEAARLEVDGRRISESDEERSRKVVVVGEVAADRIGISVPRGELLIDGTPYGVVAIVTSSRAAPELLDGVVVARSDSQIAAGWEVDDSSSVLIRTVPGAVRQVAEQAPRQLSPANPAGFSSSAPPDPAQFRKTLESDTRRIMRSFSAIAIVLGVATTSLVSLSTVNSRRGAIGLLIAMGATRHHIFRLIVTECALAGLVSGVVGTAVGLVAVSAVCISRDWQLVLAPWLPLAAIAGTGFAGIVAGVAPSWAATRVDPVESLRSD